MQIPVTGVIKKSQKLLKAGDDTLLKEYSSNSLLFIKWLLNEWDNVTTRKSLQR